ncbi:HAD-IA family hydrolase [Streptomyces sp. SID4920]|nr:HAD-IA family hydrolase [Streptomyces sp. SID4920]MYX63796.1 HAD-IA family hydrolase [Streptomyces sp. SID8373]
MTEMSTVRTVRRAALFDLDSTLTDHAGAFDAWAREFCVSTGVPLSSLRRAETCHAGARHAFFAELKADFGLRQSIASLHADYRRRSAELVPYRPDVCAAMQQLVTGGWQLGVVTNGAPDAQRLKLQVACLTDYFSSVVISGEYGIRKPDPALFQVALDELGVADPARSVVTGDCLVSDIGGGARAGLRTVWIADGRTRSAPDPFPTHTAQNVVQAAEWLLADPPRPASPSYPSLVSG